MGIAAIERALPCSVNDAIAEAMNVVPVFVIGRCRRPARRLAERLVAQLKSRLVFEGDTIVAIADPLKQQPKKRGAGHTQIGQRMMDLWRKQGYMTQADSGFSKGSYETYRPEIVRLGFARIERTASEERLIWTHSTWLSWSEVIAYRYMNRKKREGRLRVD